MLAVWRTEEETSELDWEKQITGVWPGKERGHFLQREQGLHSHHAHGTFRNCLECWVQVIGSNLEPDCEKP